MNNYLPTDYQNFIALSLDMLDGKTKSKEEKLGQKL